MVGYKYFCPNILLLKMDPLGPTLTGNTVQNPRKNTTYTDKLQIGIEGGSFRLDRQTDAGHTQILGSSTQ